MQRYDHLWERIATLENMEQAWRDTKRRKRYAPALLAAEEHIEEVLSDLLRDFVTGEWRPTKYYAFEVRTEVKRRLIHAPCVRDRIAQHAICRVIEPLFDKKFIYDLYSGRRGKGPLAAARRVQCYLRQEGAAYVLQGDIRHYYPSIDHTLLKHLLRGTIKDARLLICLDRIIDSYEAEAGKGLPLGALLSQLFANLYLSEFDHYLKETLHVRRYARLMDDFVIVAESKEELRCLLDEIRWYLETQRKLTLNRKTQIYPARRGVDFAGYRIFRTRLLPRKRNVKAARRRFRRLSRAFRRGEICVEDTRPSVMSFLGYMRHAKAERTTRSTLRYLTLRKE
ncbi:MAG: reverse transcriptase/maturase family protein [Selenomonadaceae bacterium]|nr:reverse transcriptase/maturase family protein [Selenomonadaceae bacterium]